MIMLRGNNTRIPQAAIEEMKNKEAPIFDEGKLLRCKPIRHMIPRTNFYYSNKEWFKEKSASLPEIKKEDNLVAKTNEANESDVPKSPSSPKTQKPTGTTLRRKSSKQVRIDNDEITNSQTDFSSQEYQSSKQQSNIPTKVYADSYIRTDAAKWKSTPVPGFRTCTYFDQYRRQALKHYDNVYDRTRGVVPKYGGYVPGLKFRYGSTFGQLTHNAKEIGIERNLSRTWGGAVSLF